MENRRILLAVVLAAVIVIAWNVLVVPVVAPPPAEPPGVEAPAGSPAERAGDAGAAPPAGERPADGAAAAAGDTVESEDTAAGAAAEEGAALDFGAERVEAAAEELVVLESDRVRATFSNRGAELVSYLLKRQVDKAGEPLELVRQRGSDPYPFALITAGDRSHRLNGALFTVEEETDPAGSRLLRFRHRSELGAAEKVFRLTEQDFLDVEVAVAGDARWGVMLGPGVRNYEGDENGEHFLNRGFGYRRGSETEFIAAKKLEEDLVLPAAGLRWLTLEDNFFLAAVIPQEGVDELIVRPVAERATVDPEAPRFLPAGTEVPGEELKLDQLLVIEAGDARIHFLTLLDAKRYSRLVDLPYGLEETVRWGWLGFLTKPLYLGLEWIHGEWVSNYGWAIVLITVLIKLLFFPLTYKSQQSMSKMQELNPKVQAIRTKYRPKLKDRQGRPNIEAQRQMNEEVMAVYKSAGVNPASGCLPILLQMPVFFAFYRLLYTSVELRNAPWIGWITDLSAADPYYVLPIVMGVTSLLMQRMMPAAPDPTQRMLLQAMPVVFTFFALTFPSGLVLYWVTNNLLTMVQQAVLLRSKKRQDERDKAKGKERKDET